MVKSNMEKTIKIDEEFSELIPNPVGTPCKKASSEKVQNAHSHWKEASSQIRQSRDQSESSYWQKASSCASL